MTPTIAYLLSFGPIQVAIAKTISTVQPEGIAPKARYISFTITGFSASFLTSAALG
ncbi:MAG: hypothetical protein AAF889_09160 [Cyanobacteria bacterium P01_D01_bin.73]